MSRRVFAAVIGGGAAGLMCALRAAERHPGLPIVIIEKADRVGKKLLVTGNGRCNLTHVGADAASYHGEGSERLINILFENYNNDAVLSVFHALGLLTYTDSEGRVYPRTNLATSVLDVLRLHLKRRGVTELCGAAVTNIRPCDDRYEIRTQEERIVAEKVVVAVGGRADYAGRENGSGELLKMLGLHTTALFPALSPVRVKGDSLRSLKGIRAEAAVTLLKNGQAVRQSRGEVQFTENALSGICVFDLSREATKGGCELSLNLLPCLEPQEVRREILSRIRRGGNAPVSEIFIGMLHKNLAQYLLKACGITPATACNYISDNELNLLCKTVVDCRFPCEASADFRKSQVTAGGVKLACIDPHTFECKDMPGLYLVGEALDIDGDCGGYNLQFAWASGMCAGDSL